MTEPINPAEPSPLPIRHRRILAGGTPSPAAPPADASIVPPSDQAGPLPLPVRWSRRTALEVDKRAGEIAERVDRWHRYHLWRSRLTTLAVTIVLLVLLGLGVSWLRFTLHSSRIAEEAESESPTTEEAPPVPADKEDGPHEPAAPEPKIDLSGLRDQVLPAVVSIQKPNGRGTGFVIGEGLVATAYHVVRRGDTASVVFRDGERVEVVEHVADDIDRDAAIVRVVGKRTWQPLKLASAVPSPGETVAAFDHGGGELQGRVLELGQGAVSGRDTRGNVLRTTLHTVPGWSGGPVVNLKGEVVGVNSMLDGAAFEASGIRISTGSAAIPAAVFQELLKLVQLNEAIRRDPTKAEQFWQRAALLETQCQWGKAVEDYDQFIKLQPNNAEAYRKRGRAYAARRCFEPAIADFTQAIKLNPKSTDAYRDRAAAREENGDYDGAIADLRDLVRLAPKAGTEKIKLESVRLHTKGGKSYLLAKNYDKAVSHFSEVIQVQPDNSEIRAARADAYKALGQSGKAVADYTEILRRSPRDAQWLMRRAPLYIQMGEHDKAIADYTEAIRIDPDNADAYTARGAVHGARRDFQRAIDDCTTAIRLAPGLAKAYFNRASAYEKQGNAEKAARDLARARELGYRPE